ncbi:MAG: U32 family peptidase [Patescibacteria group bacterium]|nr:U32 family peptidase [Patescibacteria group bacterium]MDD4303897.1 U32 family peptidase [Patescibacteria group bacterium]MDD4695116.1 U32 family peptidase [Patescibacteria group bacterium]
MTKLKKPELLIPAGDLEKLETAYLYGADICYMGVKGFSLRTKKSEIDFDEIKQAISIARHYKKKIFLALNSFIYDNEIKQIEKIIKELNIIKPDALIIADPGIINIATRLKNKIPIHLSTQVNTLNSESIKFWKKNGVKRIVLARELSHKQLIQIKKNVSNIELEIFVHGALCVSYSGRCYLSKYLVDKDSNRGECTQPCRWQWQAHETIKSDRVLNFEQIDNTNYILNSKDLCLIEKFPEIFKLNFSSLKVEGRMKSSYYVAIVSMIYKNAIDDYFKSPKIFLKNLKYYKKELKNISHRDYTINFFDGYNDNTMNFKNSGYIKNYTMIGIVEKYDTNKKELYINCRNEIKENSTIEILNWRQGNIEKIKTNKVFDLNKKEFIKSAHNGYYIKISCDKKFEKNSIIRKKIKVISK